jgi:hypothetical protein
LPLHVTVGILLNVVAFSGVERIPSVLLDALSWLFSQREILRGVLYFSLKWHLPAHVLKAWFSTVGVVGGDGNFGRWSLVERSG